MKCQFKVPVELTTNIQTHFYINIASKPLEKNGISQWIIPILYIKSMLCSLSSFNQCTNAILIFFFFFTFNCPMSFLTCSQLCAQSRITTLSSTTHPHLTHTLKENTGISHFLDHILYQTSILHMPI